MQTKASVLRESIAVRTDPETSKMAKVTLSIQWTAIRDTANNAHITTVVRNSPARNLIQ